MNTILKEMGLFLASSEWNEWINFHSKWVSYQPGHSIWAPLLHRLCHKLTFVFRTMFSPVKYSDHEKIMFLYSIRLIAES